MNLRVFYILLLSSVLNLSKVQSQTSWQVSTKEETVSAYKKVCDWFINSNSYSFQVKYTSFQSHTSSEVIETSDGFYKRSGKKYVSYAIGIRTLQNEKMRMVIDTADKVIAVTNPGSLNPSMQSSEDLIKLLENVKSLRKMSVNGTTTYRIDFRKNELYDAYEFTVNNKGFLDKLTYFYAEQTEKEYGDGEDEKPSEKKVKPRLEIIFSQYMSPANTKESEFTDQAILVNNSNKITLLNKYKSYQVNDYRTPAKN